MACHNRFIILLFLDSSSQVLRYIFWWVVVTVMNSNELCFCRDKYVHILVSLFDQYVNLITCKYGVPMAIPC